MTSLRRSRSGSSLRSSVFLFFSDSTSKILSVEIDPNHEVPDFNPSNNTLVNLQDAPVGLTATKVFDSYMDAIGGREKLIAVKDIATKMTASVQGTEINIDSKKKESDKYLMTVTIPAANLVAVKYLANGDHVTIMGNGREQKVDEIQKQGVLREAVIFPELEYAKEGFQTKLLGVQNSNGHELYVVQVTSPEGGISKIYYDSVSGLKTKQELFTDKVTLTTEFSNYTLVDGIKIPYTQVSNNFGQNIEMKVVDVKINKGIADSVFK